MQERMRVAGILVGVAVVAGFVWVAVALATAREAGVRPAPAFVSASGAGWSEAGDAWVQADGNGAGENDDRVGVQVWTVMAGGGALSVGLLLFLARVVMGGVKRPPDHDEGHH